MKIMNMIDTNEFMPKWIEWSRANARIKIKSVLWRDKTQHSLMELDKLMTVALIPLSHIVSVRDTERPEKVQSGETLVVDCRTVDCAKQLFYLVCIAGGTCTILQDEEEPRLWVKL